MMEFFKGIDGIAYIIYVVVLLFFILALVGYISERKMRALKKESEDITKQRLEYEKAKGKENSEEIKPLKEVVASTTPTTQVVPVPVAPAIVPTPVVATPPVQTPTNNQQTQ